MPNSERTTMKEDAKRAIAALERGAGYLLRIRAQYDPNYPQYVEAIDVLLQATSDLRDAYVQFSKQI